MDRKELGKVIAGASLLALTVILATIAAIWIVNSHIKEIGLGNSLAYQDYWRALTFSRDTSDTAQKWYVFGGTVIIYLGLALFISSLICVFTRRSIRFLFLPISGVCAFEASAFLLMVLYHLKHTVVSPPEYSPHLIFGITVALIVIGIASFVLGIIFPRRLIVDGPEVEQPRPLDETEERFSHRDS